jgi:hypothetical protein
MSLPPVPNFKFMWYPHEKEEIAEYGRQCWNAAIAEAITKVDPYYHESDALVYALISLKLDSNTVSQEP